MGGIKCENFDFIIQSVGKQCVTAIALNRPFILRPRRRICAQVDDATSPQILRFTQVVPKSLVILSLRRRICAQVEDARAQRDPSVDLALSSAEWVRMTMASLIRCKKKKRV